MQINDDLRISSNGVKFITKWEGLKLSKYLCPAGKWTIGVGHVILPHENISDTITKERAESILRSDLVRFEKAIKKFITVRLNQNQFDALVSFIFNTGEGGIRNTSVQSTVNEQKFSEVPEKLQMWSKMRQNGKLVVSQGLLRRRMSESELFMLSVPEPPSMIFHLWTKESLKVVQAVLTELNFYDKSIDGIYGPGTAMGLKKYCMSINFLDGQYDDNGIAKSLYDSIVIKNLG